MDNKQGRFEGSGSLQLFYQRWCEEGMPKAILAIVHGLGEYSGRYMNVVQHLAPKGYAVYGFDHRGHGQSPGNYCHVTSWDEYRGDVRAFLQLIRTLEPGRPVFLYGHSMGALIVLDFVLREPGGLRGAILSSPPIEPVGVAKPLLIAIARLLTRLYPSFRMKLGIDPAAISRDPAVVQAYRDDPLVRDQVSVRWGTEALDTTLWVKEQAALVKLPMLIVHGTADRMHSPAGSERFYQAIDFPDKELLLYPGSYHEVHNDLDHAIMVRDLEQWMDKHV